MITGKVEMTVGGKSGGVRSIEGLMSDPAVAKALLIDAMLIAISLGETVVYKPVYKDGKDK